MESILIYIVAGVFIVLRYYFESKNKEAKAKTPQPQAVKVDAPVVKTNTPANMPANNQTSKKSKKKAKKSLATEFAEGSRFEEGSQRSQHSSQYENSPHVVQNDHSMHENFNESSLADDKPMVELDAQKMRDALIYQTILNRPEF